MLNQSQLASPRVVTILLAPKFDGWSMPPFAPQKWTYISGGIRALIELAAGVATAGYEVELRGSYPEAEVAAIEEATSTRMGRPSDRRRPAADELVVVPEGAPEPLSFARVAFSRARAVMLIQGALGLFGWSFDDRPTPREEELLTLEASSVGRPEQLVAARAFGLELWSNVSAICEQGRSVGVPVQAVGSGRPIPYPEPREKELDVLVMGANRWSPLAREALAGLPPLLKTLVLPRVGHAEALAAFSLARVLIHPARIEGRSRIAEEARAMGAVPVVLASNTFGEGYGEEYGSVVVEDIDEIAPAVAALLADPVRLERLAANGRRTARAIGDWQQYCEGLATAIASPDMEVASLEPGRAQLGDRLETWSRGLGAAYRRAYATQLAAIERRLSR